MKSTFSVIYYLKRQVVKKDGTVPVMGRITVDGSQTQFSCKLTVDPKLWDTKGGRVTGRSTAALETNRMLDKMRVRINKHYQEIMERDNFVTAEKVKNAFLGLEHRYHTLLQVFRQHNEDYAKQVEAGMKAKGTFDKYKIVYKHLQEFLTIRYHVKDIALKELTPAFISDFEMFLRTDKHCCTNTVWLYVCPLRTMVFIAINNEWLTRDPFREYEIKKEETTRSFLTKDEIRLLMEGKLKMLDEHGYPDACIYGHALEGNYHFIIAQSFDTDAEVNRYRHLMEEVERLVIDKYDGSLKAEHGTGRNMAPFVEKEWGAEIFGIMKEVKALFDPKNILNPGVIFNDDPECYIKNFKPLPLANPVYVVLYVIWLVAIWFHLSHGFWSAMQTLGWNGKTWFCRWKAIGIAYVTVLMACFLAVVLAFFFGVAPSLCPCCCAA